MRARILIIDDQPSVIEVYRQVLEEGELYTAEDGMRGLEEFAAVRPDVVFCDIRMPTMDGLEFLKQAREMDPDIPVIFVTAYGDKEATTRALQLGAFDFIDKPFQINAIRAAMERAFRHRKLLHRRRRDAELTGRVESFGRQINKVLSFDELLECLSAALAPSLGVRLFTLYLYDAGTHQFRVASSNRLDGSVGQEIALEDVRGPMKDAVVSRRAVEGELGDGERAHGTSVSIPLVVRDSLVGVLNLDGKLESQEPFDELDISFYSIAAEHLASAISVRQEAVKLNRALEALQRTQQRLIQSEKLVAVTKLVAGVAHELKNPLTSLQFAALNISNEAKRIAAAGAETGRMGMFVEAMAKDVERLHDRVHRFVLFARPERVQRQMCAPGSIARQALEQLDVESRAPDVQVELRCETDLPDVMADAEAFSQAVLNLLVNAVEAVGERGQVELSLQCQGGEICIQVRDSGPGIPEELATHVFELFFTTKPRGSGIGLSQVHVFCDTHGGRVSFSSSEKGACFEMRLPVGREGEGTASGG
ncbi:MAG: response regulator [Deltaproteobacteria bacterium]|nr:response regulator [Deltaproteobacteria bacterium]